MFVTAILLAAGESSRMGRQKALLPWADATLIEYQLTQLSSIDAIRQMIVVTGYEPERIKAIASRFPRATITHNSAYTSGKVSSILSGLHALSPGGEAIVLLAVDQPRPAGVTQRLVDRHAERRPAITVPVRQGRRGHPVVFARGLLPELLAISEESLGVRAVLQRHQTDTLEVEIDDPIIHRDLNVSADQT